MSLLLTATPGWAQEPSLSRGGALRSVAPLFEPSQSRLPVIQEPNQPGAAAPSDAQTRAAADQRGTTETPLVVKILPAPEGQAVPAKPAEKSDAVRPPEPPLGTPDWPIVVLTGGLVFVGALQLYVFGRQAQQLKRSVDAAERSEEIRERAYLWPGLGKSAVEDGATRFLVTVHNTGRTAATLKSVHLHLCPENIFPPPTMNYTDFRREDVIPPEMRGATMETGAFCDLKGNEPMILHGYVTYTDVFKKLRTCSWKHRVHRTGLSEPLDGCYSDWT